MGLLGSPSAHPKFSITIVLLWRSPGLKKTELVTETEAEKCIENTFIATQLVRNGFTRFQKGSSGVPAVRRVFL